MMKTTFYFVFAAASAVLTFYYGHLVIGAVVLYLFLCVVCPIFAIPLFLFLDVPASYGRLPPRK